MGKSLKDRIRVEVAQQEVGPQHDGHSILQCRMPKKDLLDVLGCDLQAEEKATLTFTSDKLIGPAGEVCLDILPTMEGRISLHSFYAQALYLMVECPDTKGKEITLKMSKKSPSLHIFSSGAAGLDCKLPAHLDADTEHPEVYGAEDVQDLLPSEEEQKILDSCGFLLKENMVLVGGGQ